MERKRLGYAIYPGTIKSVNDGEWHRITYDMLINLYGVDPAKCFRGDVSASWRGRKEEDYYHLHPSRNGHYGNVPKI